MAATEEEAKGALEFMTRFRSLDIGSQIDDFGIAMKKYDGNKDNLELHRQTRLMAHCLYTNDDLPFKNKNQLEVLDLLHRMKIWKPRSGAVVLQDTEQRERYLFSERAEFPFQIVEPPYDPSSFEKEFLLKSHPDQLSEFATYVKQLVSEEQPSDIGIQNGIVMERVIPNPIKTRQLICSRLASQGNYGGAIEILLDSGGAKPWLIMWFLNDHGVEILDRLSGTILASMLHSLSLDLTDHTSLRLAFMEAIRARLVGHEEAISASEGLDFKEEMAEGLSNINQLMKTTDAEVELLVPLVEIFKKLSLVKV